MSVRQVRQLAEGQKSAKVEHHFTLATPSANQDSWRKGSNFPRKTQIFGFLRHHLAEGVEFPEKKCNFTGRAGCHLAQGFPGWIAARIDSDFEPCLMAIASGKIPGKSKNVAGIHKLSFLRVCSGA
jgi:hypothetical protein